MRVLLQRVEKAAVVVAGDTVGAIESGLLALVGVAATDDVTTADALASKTAKIRLFSDAQGKMNRSVVDVGGAVLAVSQFTLYADTRSGNRPGFSQAALPAVAEPLFNRYVETLRATVGLHVETGRFGADMDVKLHNDGPVTVLLEKDAGP